MKIEIVNAIMYKSLVYKTSSWFGIYFERYRYSIVEKIRKRWYRCSDPSSPPVDSNANILWIREALSQDPDWSEHGDNKNKQSFQGNL